MRRLAICMAVGAALLGGCQAEEGSGSDGGGGSAPRPARGTAVVDQEQSGTEELGAGVGGGGSAAGGITPAVVGIGLEVPPVGPTIIKTADVAVEVERDAFGDAMASVTEIAARHGGFVVTSTRSGEESRRGSVTVRIPSDRFETALGEIRALGKVKRETISGQDVGQEFVDLEARLRNLHAQEAVLLKLFDQATSVADTIRIQSELSGVQLEIERIEGRLRLLRDQTDLGTITVSLSEEGASAPGRFGSAFDRAWEGILAVLYGIVVFLGYALPLLAIGIPLWLVGRRVWRGLAEQRG
ncbi:MAG: DUF4349 domain-containing protein [Actinomycetota bacterium]